jgi:uncharacterized protein YggU (UPF0235/DUF167 family)
LVAAPGPFAQVRGGIHVAVHLTPKAKQTAIGLIGTSADGYLLLKARVTAAPKKSKANAALCRLLAKEWGLAPSTLTVISGATARNKIVRIEGNTATVLHDLNKWAKERHG